MSDKNTNPFKELDKNVHASENLKNEVFSSIASLKFLIKLSEHFTATLGSVLSDTVQVMLNSKEKKS